MGWTCGACTFDNSDENDAVCEICETPRSIVSGGNDRSAGGRTDQVTSESRKRSSNLESVGSESSGRSPSRKRPATAVAGGMALAHPPSSSATTTTTTTTTAAFWGTMKRPQSTSTKSGANLVQRTLMGTRALPPVDKSKKKKSGSTSTKKGEQPPTSTGDGVDGMEVSSSSAAPSSRQGEARRLDSGSSGATPSLTTTAPAAAAAPGPQSNFFDNKWKQQKAKEVMAQVFGITMLRGLQSAAIQCALDGTSQIVVMATGAGKSLCYQLPALVLGGTTIVISPLIALMEDQVQALLSKKVEAAVLASSKTETHNRHVLERLVGRSLAPAQKPEQQKQKESKQGKPTPDYKPIALLYCTPEQVQRTQFRSILQELYRNSLQRHGERTNQTSVQMQKQNRMRSRHYLSLIAIDEAHCVSTWGHDFRPAYRKLEWFTTSLPRVPVIACTATATAQVLQDISQCLGLSPKSSKLHVGSLDRVNVFYRVAHVDALQFRHEQRGRPGHSNATGTVVDPIRKHLLEHIGKMHAQAREQKLKCAGIIYCRKREHTLKLTNWINQQHKPLSSSLQGPSLLTHHPIRAVAYHGGLSVKDRNAAQEGWTSGEYQVVVATSAFGMGIDVSHVRYVVHWCMPQSIEAFYQESGRAGRDGEPAHSLLYVSHDDIKTLRFIVSQDKNQQLAPRKLAALETMVEYATKPHCRRGHLLRHFGVTKINSNVCQGKCDYCSNPESVKKALEQAAAQQSNPFAIRRQPEQRKPDWDGQWDRPHGDTAESDDDDERESIFGASVDGLGITSSPPDPVAGSLDDGTVTRKGNKNVNSILAKYEAIELHQNQKNGFVHFCRKAPSASSSQVVKVPTHFRQNAASRPSSKGDCDDSSPPIPGAASVTKSEMFASEAERLRAEIEELKAQTAAAVKKRDTIAASSGSPST